MASAKPDSGNGWRTAHEKSIIARRANRTFELQKRARCHPKMNSEPSDQQQSTIAQMLLRFNFNRKRIKSSRSVVNWLILWSSTVEKRKYSKLSLLFCFMSIVAARTGGGRGNPVQGPKWAQYTKKTTFWKKLVVSIQGVCKRWATTKKSSKTIKEAAIQHPRFPCSPLPKYWSGPTVLNFAVRMGCGAFTVVWPYDEVLVAHWYTASKIA